MAVGVVLIRDWLGTEDSFVAFSRGFGDLERASPHDPRHGGQLFRVVSRAADQTGVGRYWHADGFARVAAPALLTIYHVAHGASPASGTAFIDGLFSWQDLAPGLRDRLRGRSWVHQSGSTHPFVVDHPFHRYPALSVNLGKITAITNMGTDEVRQTIDELAAELDRMPRYVHAWEPGQILLVDNRRMLHHGPATVDSERTLWRTSVVRFPAGGLPAS